MGEFGHEHLALLAERAGDQGDLDPLIDGLRHGGAGPDALIIGMGMDKEQSAIGHSATISP